MLRYLVREITIYAAIALDLALGTLTWLLVAGLLPHDYVNFNVLGSLVLIGLCATPYTLVHLWLRKQLPQYQN